MGCSVCVVCFSQTMVIVISVIVIDDFVVVVVLLHCGAQIWFHFISFRFGVFIVRFRKNSKIFGGGNGIALHFITKGMQLSKTRNEN